MTLRERLLAVFRGETPDAAPIFADLSHWHAAETGATFVPARRRAPDLDQGLLDLHRDLHMGYYSASTTFWEVCYDSPVEETIEMREGLYKHTLRTPLGAIEEQRRFSAVSYSYDIIRRMIRTVDDLRVLNYAYSRRHVHPTYEGYDHCDAAVGDLGIVGGSSGFSGLGFLMSRYMGIAETVYALMDHTCEIEETIELINHARLEEMNVVVKSPCPIIFFSDNLSSDVYTPRLFSKHMKEFYVKLADMCHAEGKWLSVHVDGRLRGLLRSLRECGVDSVDAVTPLPDGDVALDEARAEAGPEMILWGGIPASIWQESTPDEEFLRYARNCFERARENPRLVIGPSDQVVPGTPRRRLEMISELADEYT